MSDGNTTRASGGEITIIKRAAWRLYGRDLVFTCPRCGAKQWDDRATIWPSGELAYEIGCAEEGCQFGGAVRLEGYEPPDDTRKAYYDGQRRRRGGGEKTNPFTRDDEQFEIWNRGWDEALKPKTKEST